MQFFSQSDLPLSSNPREAHITIHELLQPLGRPLPRLLDEAVTCPVGYILGYVAICLSWADAWTTRNIENGNTHLFNLLVLR
jgi:hypothetical protein